MNKKMVKIMCWILAALMAVSALSITFGTIFLG